MKRIAWHAQGLWLLLLLPASAAAQFSIITTGIPGCNFGGGNEPEKAGMIAASCIPFFIAHLVQLAFSLVGVIFLISIMYAGYQYALGGVTGDKEAGKRRIFTSVVGLAASICAALLLGLVINLFRP